MHPTDMNKLLLRLNAALLPLLVGLMTWVVLTTQDSQIEIARLHVMMIEVNKNVQRLNNQFDRRLTRVEQRLLDLEKND